MTAATSSRPIERTANPDYKLDPALTYDPKGFPASVQGYAQADFGPNLSNISAKFQSQPQGLKWLANWIMEPRSSYHPKSLMPNLQLSEQDAADIASWILSVPGEWPVKVEVPAVESPEVTAAVDELVKPLRLQERRLQEARRQDSRRFAQRSRRPGRKQAQARREVDVSGREDHRPPGLFRVPHDPGLRECQTDRDRPQ